MSTITVTITGNVTSGSDGGGIFGPAGASLAGDPFVAVWTGDYSIGPEGTVYGANITINNHTFDFSQNIFHTDDYFRSDDPSLAIPVVIYQVTDTNGNELDTEPYRSSGLISITLDYTQTQARLFVNAVPAPIVGTGLLPLLLLAAFTLRRWRQA